ncbi:hypothetical protein AVEN_235863-1, partial [Araneus ventricosus]
FLAVPGELASSLADIRRESIPGPVFASGLLSCEFRLLSGPVGTLITAWGMFDVLWVAQKCWCHEMEASSMGPLHDCLPPTS